MPVTTSNGYASLPAGCETLFADAHNGELLLSRQWLQTAQDRGLRPGDQLRVFAIASEQGEPDALVPVVYSRLYATHAGSRVLHFMYPEDLAFVPLGARDEPHAAAAFASVIDELQRDRQAYDVIRVSPLLSQTAFANGVVASLRGTHFVQGYHYPAERYETVQGLTFKQFLAGRPRPLRESLERNTRLLLQGGRGRFHFVVNRELLEASWGDMLRIIESTPAEGEPEPPDYLPGMLGIAAEYGHLRAGLFYLDDVPVAMQFWVVSAGAARCLRLWASQAQRVFPIDDVLTQLIAVCLIDGDQVAELNFGAIDETYARDWAPKQRARFGVAAFNPRTLRGLRGALRHVGLPRLLSVPKKLWRRMAG